MKTVLCLIALLALAVTVGCTTLSTSFVATQRQWYETSAKPSMIRDAAAHPEDAARIGDSIAGEDLVLTSAEKSVGLPTTQPAK